MKTTIEYLNRRNMCLVCFKNFNKDNPRIKHHVKYFPEKVAYVHYSCHNDIHNPETNKGNHLIQYNRSESIRFYKEKKKNISTE